MSCYDRSYVYPIRCDEMDLKPPPQSLGTLHHLSKWITTGQLRSLFKDRKYLNIVLKGTDAYTFIKNNFISCNYVRLITLYYDLLCYNL